jgi:hypothetical protein
MDSCSFDAGLEAAGGYCYDMRYADDIVVTVEISTFGFKLKPDVVFSTGIVQCERMIRLALCFLREQWQM